MVTTALHHHPVSLNCATTLLILADLVQHHLYVQYHRRKLDESTIRVAALELINVSVNQTLMRSYCGLVWTVSTNAKY